MISFSGSDARADGPAEGDPPGRRKLPHNARITDGGEIRRIVRTGRRVPAGTLQLFVAPSSGDRPRVAVVVPRFGHSAVQRNRLRRRLREITRVEWMPSAIERGLILDVVLMARRAAYETSFGELRSSLRHTFESL